MGLLYNQNTKNHKYTLKKFQDNVLDESYYERSYFLYLDIHLCLLNFYKYYYF